jgi:hypothetical protein
MQPCGPCCGRQRAQDNKNNASWEDSNHTVVRGPPRQLCCSSRKAKVAVGGDEAGTARSLDVRLPVRPAKFFGSLCSPRPIDGPDSAKVQCKNLA